MKHALFLALSVCLAWSVSGQPTFEKIYLGTGGFKRNLIELSSQNLLTVTAATGTGVSLLAPGGDLLQSKYYWGDTVLNIMSLRRYADNEFYYVSGYHKDTCTLGSFGLTTQTYPLIGRMDSLGNVLAANYYALNASGCIGLPVDLSVTMDKSVITWGGSNFVLRSDSMGVLLWAKHFRNNGAFQFVKELPNGDLLAGINLDTAGAVIARMDAAGDFLWCKSYIRPKGMIADCHIESDSSFIVMGFTDSIASTNGFAPLLPSYHPKLFMMKLDGVGSVQWCKGYDSDPNLWHTRRGSRIVRSHDGHYVVLANLGAEGYNLQYRPFLMKTDQNGDTLWTRSAGSNGYRYTTSDLLAYSDGGFLYNGMISGNLPDAWTGAPYIFKTDSLGHLPCSERWHPVQVMDLFPTDSSFTLTSVDGATMYPAFVSDTIFDPITVYDACVVATPVPYTYMRKFSVRPNPNTGRFIVEFKDPLMAESYYSVYDAMGRLLLQRPLPAGSTTEQVDLSRFGLGAYVIKFTSPEGVQHERVVVE